MVTLSGCTEARCHLKKGPVVWTGSFSGSGNRRKLRLRVSGDACCRVLGGETTGNTEQGKSSEDLLRTLSSGELAWAVEVSLCDEEQDPLFVAYCGDHI